MSSNFTSIKIKEEDKSRLLKKCKEEFLDNNPKFKGMNIPQHFLITKIIDFYLK